MESQTDGFETLVEQMKDDATDIVKNANADLEKELVRRKSHHSHLALKTRNRLGNDAFEFMMSYLEGSHIGRQLNRACRAKHFRYMRTQTIAGFI